MGRDSAPFTSTLPHRERNMDGLETLNCSPTCSSPKGPLGE